jgi:hypothetical protein
MPEDQIILIEETETEQPTVPVFKVAAITTAAFLVTRNVKRHYQARKYDREMKAKLHGAVRKIMDEYEAYVDVTPEDIIEGRCTEKN